MATKAELMAVVGIDSRKFTRGLRIMKARAKRFAVDIAGDTKALAGGFAKLGLAVVAAGAAYGVGAKQVLSYSDSLDKANKRTGVSVEDLAVLGREADLAGTSFEVLEKSIRRQASSLFDLELGLSTAKDAFGELGLSFEELQGKSPADVMSIIAGRLDALDDDARKSAVAMKIWGRAGTQLIPMLGQLAGGLEDARKESKRLGIIISPEQARAAAKAVDEFADLKRSIMGLALAAVDIGSLTKAITFLKESAISLRQNEAFLKFAKSIQTGSEKAIKSISDLSIAFFGLDSDVRKSLSDIVKISAIAGVAIVAGIAGPVISMAATVSAMLVTTFSAALGLVVKSVAVAVAFIAKQFAILGLHLYAAISSYFVSFPALLGGLVLGPLVALVGMIAALPFGIAFERTFNFSSLLLKAWEFVKSFVKIIGTLSDIDFTELLKGDFDKALEPMRESIAGIKAETKKTFAAIDEVSSNSGKTFAENLADGFLEVEKGLKDTAKNVGDKFADGFSEAGKKGKEALLEFTAPGAEKIGDFLSDKVVTPFLKLKSEWEKLSKIPPPEAPDLGKGEESAGKIADDFAKIEKSAGRLRSRGIAIALPGLQKSISEAVGKAGTVTRRKSPQAIASDKMNGFSKLVTLAVARNKTLDAIYRRKLGAWM